MSKKLTEKEIFDLRQKGFKVTDRVKPKPDLTLKVMEKLSTEISQAIKSIKPTDINPIIKPTVVVQNDPVKRNFELIPERNREGFITKIRINEV